MCNICFRSTCFYCCILSHFISIFTDVFQIICFKNTFISIFTFVYILCLFICCFILYTTIWDILTDFFGYNKLWFDFSLLTNLCRTRKWMLFWGSWTAACGSSSGLSQTAACQWWFWWDTQGENSNFGWENLLSR